MDFLNDAPMGMYSDEKLLSILVSLYETGGCELRTLRIVARATGIREHFDREVGRLNGVGTTVDKPPVFLLSE